MAWPRIESETHSAFTPLLSLLHSHVGVDSREIEGPYLMWLLTANFQTFQNSLRLVITADLVHSLFRNSKWSGGGSHSLADKGAQGGDTLLGIGHLFYLSSSQ